MSEDEETSHTGAVETEAESVIVESVWTVSTEAWLIPMTFKPTGEIVYVTAELCDWIERYRSEYGAR